ncbi:DinB family protein [Luteipulveratus sp. YIM 133132]|uniref:DinB family protein n=1 Tax=Luteipulveratus flavus TaxID=3031728 RepID=UPI0023B09BC1|nr:DinB family protein [Luteipulveratus sp. YIM 133132]MDE9364702.1 DinB family protein [Luteipulveratus sp. YIM 133132]
MTTERPMPPLDADEIATLEGWLDFHRSTLEAKCAGLDDAQAATASVPPSPLTLVGLVQHLSEVERTWFRVLVAGESLDTLYGPKADPSDHEGGFEVADGATLTGALGTWRTEVAASRAACSGRAASQTVPFMGARVTLRWVYVHLIEEYARHNGHADLLRERIDGATGV